VKAFAKASGYKDSAVAIAAYTVTPTPVVANGRQVEVDAGKLTSITVTGSGPPGVGLNYILISKPRMGQCTDFNGATLNYKADASVSGVDSFTFKAKAGEVESAPATVTIAITNRFEFFIGMAKKLKIDDPEQASQSIKAALAINPNDAEAIGLKTEIQHLQQLDSQVQDLMKQFGVPGKGKAITPEKSNKAELSVPAKADQALNYEKIYDYFKAQYSKSGWWNPESERDQDLHALQSKINKL
jgi:hypothetical protein